MTKPLTETPTCPELRCCLRPCQINNHVLGLIGGAVKSTSDYLCMIELQGMYIARLDV